MIHAQIEFHNVAELRAVDNLPGLCLQRVPEEVRLALNDKAQQRVLSPAGSEIRFVSQESEVKVTLSCPAGQAEVIPFWGGFQGNQRFAINPEPRVLELTYPERLRQLEPEVSGNMVFAPQVWRLQLRGEGLHFHGIEGKGLRPPAREEVPACRYLAYGTSITHGSAATGMHLTYVVQAARRLGADLINLGVGGSAYCEPELADYMAGRADWDLSTLCLSVNMIGGGFSVEQFRERTSYMIDKMAGADPKRPVVCITILPYYADFCDQVEGRHGEGLAEEFRQVLREVVGRSPHPNVHLVEGRELLRDITGLSADLLHPADHGMIQIGENLALRLNSLL